MSGNKDNSSKPQDFQPEALDDAALEAANGGFSLSEIGTALGAMIKHPIDTMKAFSDLGNGNGSQLGNDAKSIAGLDGKS